MATNTKLLADGGYSKPSTAYVLPSQIQSAKVKLQTVKDQIVALGLKISECTRVLAGRPIVSPFSGARYTLSWLKTGLFPTQLTKQQVETIKSNLIQQRGLLYSQQASLESVINGGSGNTGGATSAKPPKNPGSTGGGSSSNTDSTGSAFSQAIKYNAPAVKEAYFYAGKSFYNEADPDWQGRGATDRMDSYIWSGNTPSKVNDASELWKTSQASKGIIQTWTPPFGISGGISADGNWATFDAGSAIQRYGFQFIYNPTTISMSYGGVQDVDPGYAASGQEEFLIQNPSVFQSTINLEIIINRMYDMKYLSSKGLKSGQPGDFYSGNVPDTKTLKEIYKKGTMYDVEFLLQTMFPYEPVASQLRGKTADVGFLGAMPVELHLGNSLRYVAQINGINVNHVIFDNRMVPLFTTISVSTNRIPDYQGIKNDTGGGGGSGGTTTRGSTGTTSVPGGGSLIGGRGIQ